jgi:hypothetical protein
MGNKVKPHRQRKLPRSYLTVEMITHTKGGPMRDRRDRRSKELDTVRLGDYYDDDEDFDD